MTFLPVLFYFLFFQIRNTVDNPRSLSSFIIAPIQSGCFSPTKKLSTLKFENSNFCRGANIALHFVNPFIMRKPILIQFKKGENKQEHFHLKESWNISFNFVEILWDNTCFPLTLSCTLIKSPLSQIVKGKVRVQNFLHRESIHSPAYQQKKFWIEIFAPSWQWQRKV